jgi:hypothetical protein
MPFDVNSASNYSVGCHIEFTRQLYQIISSGTDNAIWCEQRRPIIEQIIIKRIYGIWISLSYTLDHNIMHYVLFVIIDSSIKSWNLNILANMLTYMLNRAISLWFHDVFQLNIDMKFQIFWHQIDDFQPPIWFCNFVIKLTWMSYSQIQTGCVFLLDFKFNHHLGDNWICLSSMMSYSKNMLSLFSMCFIWLAIWFTYDGFW